jgi:hypothetical protein
MQRWKIVPIVMTFVFAMTASLDAAHLAMRLLSLVRTPESIDVGISRGADVASGARSDGDAARFRRSIRHQRNRSTRMETARAVVWIPSWRQISSADPRLHNRAGGCVPTHLDGAASYTLGDVRELAARASPRDRVRLPQRHRSRLSP